MPAFARFRYWGDAAATRAAWRGSACTVGDLGRLDDDGYLYLTGRRHDLIISGGVNVYPAEVEAVLAAVPGLREVAVFGLPDEQWGQVVCAAYVADPTVTERALRERSAHRQTRISAGIEAVEGRDPDDLVVMITYPGPDQLPLHELPVRIYGW